MKNPDHRLLGLDIAELSRRYSAAANKVFGGSRPVDLPWKVTLIEAMILLQVVHDEMLPAATINGLPGVGHVRGLVEGRNNSVLAHGVESVTRQQCDELRARALQNLRAFWRLHEPDETVDERIQTLRFVVEA